MTLDDILWNLKADRDGYNEQQANGEEDEEAVMDKELYQAAFRGHTSFLSDGAHDDAYFTRKTSEVRENIIHIAVRQEKLEFASEGARRFPKLICEGNCDNNTPLHFAAKTGNLNIMKRLIDSYMDFVNKSRLFDVIPWRVKNKEGNTPLHVALVHGENCIAEYLLEIAPKLARIRNSLKQTPLHVAVKYTGNFRRVVDALKIEVQVQGKFVTPKDYPKRVKEDSLGIISLLMRTEPSVACFRDTNGVTPLLQAALLDPPDLAAVKVILDWCPQSASVCDSTTGNTILHYLIVGCHYISDFGPDDDLKFDLPDLFCSYPEIVGLKDAQNFVGDTPSHIAVKKESDVSLHLLMNVKADLTIENKEGVYVADLILQNPEFKANLKRASKWFELHDYTFVDENIIKSHDLNEPIWRSEIRRAIKEVNLSFLSEMLNDSSGFDHLMRYSVCDSNILHALLWYSRYRSCSYHDLENVVEQVLEALPFQFCQTKDQDWNLLHQMASWHPEMINESMLELSKKCLKKLENEAGIATLCSPPWRGLDINGNTPLHILIDRASSLKISHQVKVFISFDSTLAECTNNGGMTPIHMLCGFASEDLDMEEENEVLNDMSIILESTDDDIFKKRDNYGMTPLLKASKSKCFTIVRSILEQSGPHMMSYDCYLPNGQSYMHLIACTQVSERNYRQIREILCSCRADFDHQDKEGNTPLHLAIEKGNFLFVKLFITESVSRRDYNLIEILYIQNANCQTCLHLIANIKQGSSNDCEELLQEVEKWVLQVPDVNLSNLLEALYCQDKDGNTALHLAIQKQNFQFAQLCIATATTAATAASTSYRNILEIPNIMNTSPGDLIGSVEILPRKFEQFLWSKHKVVEGMLGFRSLSGIPTTMMKDYVNTLGVTAALLATITFTAAFAVPGGLNSANGTPFLMKKASFQVFMVTDIMAMCLSMMVLFCNLWIMTISDRKQGVFVLDLTVLLLEASFYMTLLTFMTGLYVTTAITPWIAILGCGLCSLLVLLMHQRFVTGIIPGFFVPFIRMFVWSRKVYSSVTGALKHKFSCCHTKRNTVQGNHNSGQPQPDSDAKALVVMPPCEATELLIGSRPTSAHMITIDIQGSKQDGASTSGAH